jgi:hypothetical protein
MSRCSGRRVGGRIADPASAMQGMVCLDDQSSPTARGQVNMGTANTEPSTDHHDLPRCGFAAKTVTPSTIGRSN